MRHRSASSQGGVVHASLRPSRCSDTLDFLSHHLPCCRGGRGTAAPSLVRWLGTIALGDPLCARGIASCDFSTLATFASPSQPTFSPHSRRSNNITHGIGTVMRHALTASLVPSPTSAAAARRSGISASFTSCTWYTTTATTEDAPCETPLLKSKRGQPFGHETADSTPAVSHEEAHDSAWTLSHQESLLESAEGQLRLVFGPQAKLVLHRLSQRQRRTARGNVSAVKQVERPPAGTEDVPNPGGEIDSSTSLPLEGPLRHDGAPGSGGYEGAGGQSFYYRASATFRLLGFPVELAVVNGQNAKRTIESCLQQALSSDVVFIRGNNTGVTAAAAAAAVDNENGAREAAFPGHHNSRGSRVRQNKDGGKRQISSSRDRRITSRGWQTSVTGFPSSMSSSEGRLTPHQRELKAIVDELRQLSAHFSRTLKFSIKPPRAHKGGTEQETRGEGGATAEASTEKQWSCRCYVKEEWSTTPQACLALEASGSSPNNALAHCVAQLRHQYRDEMSSVDVMQEGAREVAALIETVRKTVRSTWKEESGTGSTETDLTTATRQEGTYDIRDARGETNSLPSFLRQPPTYSAQMEITDVHGNVTVYSARRQASSYVGVQTAAVAALRAENLWERNAHLLSARLTPAPLLWRLRWQFDMLVDHICRQTGKDPTEVAWVRWRSFDGDGDRNGRVCHDGSAEQTSGEGGSDGVERSTNAMPATPPTAGSRGVAILPPLLTGVLYTEKDVVVWQTTGPGRYRVMFNTYVQAVLYLLDQYSDCLTSLPCLASGVGETLLFPSPGVLELQVMRHDSFPILQYHHGKWNCYAILGTLTMQLLGCPYTTHYQYDTASTEWVVTLTVCDGLQSSYPLVQRRSKKKGEAWRIACLAAMRENFPRQYAAVLRKYPDVDLSNDTGARGARYRALPREKRIAHMGSFVDMVMTLVDEDLGWKEPRVRFRNLSSELGLPQWTAELEARVEGEEDRRTVAASPSFMQVRQARKSLFYRVAKQYFPKELDAYRALNRGDGEDPEIASKTRHTRLYDPKSGIDSSMVGHVLMMMERERPSLAPMKITLDARPQQPSQRQETQTTEATLSDVEDDNKDEFGVLCADGDTNILFSQEPELLLQPLRLSYHAQVLGERGDVLIADFDSSRATTAGEAEAIPVLVSAMKSASFHIAGAEAETLWTEYETYPFPPVSVHRDMTYGLFSAFFGRSTNMLDVPPSSEGSAISEKHDGLSDDSRGERKMGALEDVDVAAESGAPFGDSTTAFDIVFAQVGGYWFGTAVLPRFGMLPIARAVATTKRKCSSDVLKLAARRSFPRVLQYIAKNDMTLSALATDILLAPVVEQLPPTECESVRAALAVARKRRPLPPFRLLMRCMKNAYPLQDQRIRVQQSHESTHGHQYRLYLQRGLVLQKTKLQLVGYGTSTLSPTVALHRASIMALENLFEDDLAAAIKAQASYREPYTVAGDD